MKLHRIITSQDFTHLTKPQPLCDYSEWAHHSPKFGFPT